MRRIALASGLAGALLVGAAASSITGPALATAPSAGCPAGYQLLSVQSLTAQGYKAPAEVDDPTSGVESFGRPGNGDGFVCGRALPQAACIAHASGPCPVPVFYEFEDDVLPA